MRQIKFRAYDKRFNVMLSDIMPYQPSIVLSDVEFNYSYGDKADDRNEIGVDDGGPEHYCITDDQIEVMQFAGIKDRLGVEIYEGDILKCDFSRDNNGLHDSIQIVEFYEGSFGSRNKGDHFRIPALFSGRATEGMNLNYYEVIGNIYQNTELIP